MNRIGTGNKIKKERVDKRNKIKQYEINRQKKWRSNWEVKEGWLEGVLKEENGSKW